MRFLGLRTVIYPTANLDESKAWWTGVLGFAPYFDEVFYVGFLVEGYELALNPAAPADDGAVTYWGVADADFALSDLLARGATPREPVTEVGGGIRVATVFEIGGSVLGIIENPTYQHLATTVDPSDGPGR